MEYISVAMATSQAIWLKRILKEVGESKTKQQGCSVAINQ